MSLERTASKSTNSGETSEYSNIDEGQHEGRLTYVADLGSQARDYKGDVKPPCQQLSLGIEIIGSTVIIDGEKKPRILWTKPFNIFYTMDERGNEYKMYKCFDTAAKDGEVADWEAVLGVPVTVTVKHTTSGDRTYDNIDYLTTMPAKYQQGIAPAIITDGCVGNANDTENAAQKAMFGLPRFIFEKRLQEGEDGKPNLSVVNADSNEEDFAKSLPF